jgi:hypothetical protein
VTSGGGLEDEVGFESVAGSSRLSKQDSHRGGVQHQGFLGAISGPSSEEMHGPVNISFDM